MTEEIIIEAIQAKKLLEFVYVGRQRIAEPHIYGVKDGLYQVLTYQIRGTSQTGGLPNWRRFSFNQIQSLKILEESFSGARPASSHNPGSWDRLLLAVK